MTPTAPRWRVRRDPTDLPVLAIAGPWRVESPRGVEVHRVPSQRQALELACSMAAIDDLLARVALLEQPSAFGYGLGMVGGGRR